MKPEEILTHAGMKKTKQRLAVLSALCKSDEPLCAEMIFKKINGSSLSTVYRTLERFYEHGLVEKTTFDVQDSCFYSLRTERHGHYAVCLGCHKREPLEVCPVKHFDAGDFTVTGHKLEIYGYCKACRGKNQ